MSISLILLAFTAVVTIINVWKSVKKGDLPKKALIINIVLTLFAGLTFGLSWKKQADEKEQLIKEKDDQRRGDSTSYARLDSTYQNTKRLYNLTEFINHSMDTVKYKADSITARTIQLNNESRENFQVTFKEQERLFSETKRMQYPVPKDMILDCSFIFKYDSLSTIFQKMKEKGIYVPLELYRNNIVKSNPDVDSIVTYLVHRIRHFDISLEFVRKIKKNFEFTDLYVSGKVDLEDFKEHMLFQIFYDNPNFRVNILGMPVSILKNNNVLFLSDLSNSTLYINNSFCDKLFNGRTFMDSYYNKSKGISTATFESFWIDFGNVVSKNQIPIDTLGVPVIRKFEFKEL